jgi:hypothetical protein
MVRYRVDFTALPRSIDQVAEAKAAEDFLARCLRGRARKVFGEYLSTVPEGHILMTATIRAKPDQTGEDLLHKHILPKYPEATLQSWDQID